MQPNNMYFIAGGAMLEAGVGFALAGVGILHNLHMDITTVTYTPFCAGNNLYIIRGGSIVLATFYGNRLLGQVLTFSV